MDITPNNLSKKPRVLIVDNDPKARASYQALLTYWGYEPVLAVGVGNALLAYAKIKARDRRCVLALIDLRLLGDYDEDDLSGITLAVELGDVVRSIILSGYGNQKVLREILQNHKDLNFISKGDSPGKIQEILCDEAKKVVAAKRQLIFEHMDILDEILHSPLGELAGDYPDQIADVLARLFPNAKKLKLEKLDLKLLSSNISNVPRPTSVVLKVYEDDYEPYVVKIARASRIEKEVINYNQYIHRRLPENFAAKLINHVVSWDIGGASYSYVGDFNVTTFSNFYEERSFEDIAESLKFFFNNTWSNHYQHAHEETYVSLFELYSKVWGDWYQKRVKGFPPLNPNDYSTVHQNFNPPEPIGWLKARIAETPTDISWVASTRVAITHGDLHGDNLLIDDRKNAWVIDFERCGEGHALQDFVELEADIFNRFEARNENFPAYVKMCFTVLMQKTIQHLEAPALVSADVRIQKALQTISLLRSLAAQHTKITDAREYLLGLLFNMIFRATIVQSAQPRALMLASIICHRLDHWDEPWPPPEWKIPS